MKMLSLLLLLLFAGVTPQAWAQNTTDARYTAYVDPTIAMLTDYVFDAGIVKLEKTDDVVEYMMIRDCPLYDMIKDDMFKQQQMMLQLSQGQAQRQKSFNRELKIRSFEKLFVKDYNFTTQSFDLDPRSAVKNVGTMDVLSKQQFCGAYPSMSKFPTNFRLKLNFPFSLLRIPFDAKSAKNMYQNFDTFQSFTSTSSKVVYAVFYLTVEGVTNTIKPTDYGVGLQATLLGQLDAVEIYTDKEYTKKIKQLDYSAAY